MAEDHPRHVSAYDGSAAARDHGVSVAGSGNIVITGDVAGNVTITIAGRDVRGEELAYLDRVAAQYRFWAEKYTPLAGIAEVRAAAQNGPRLDLPMLFMPAGFEKLVEHGFGEGRQVERVPVDDLREAVARYRRLVLLGEPGSGKTTTLWRLAYDYAIAAQADARVPLPLLVPLGGYSGDESPLRYAQDYFGELAPHLPAYLRSGRVVLLLDALNEMPQRGYRERVARIQALLDTYTDPQLDTYSNLLVVVTCRALDYVETLRLEKLVVKPLDLERQRTYLHRYLGEEDGEKLLLQMAGGEAVVEFWREVGMFINSLGRSWTLADPLYWAFSLAYGKGEVERSILLPNGTMPPLLALGRNPFMLVMLAQVYAAGGGTLPANRGKLFAAFVDTLLGREERRCEPARWPGTDLIRRCLSHLAFAMQRAGKHGTAVDSNWAAQKVGRGVSDPLHLLYLGVSATLLDRAGDRIRFVHQLVQEYFAALDWDERITMDEDLRAYWPSGWLEPSGWEETALLLTGILPDMTSMIEKLLLVNPPLAARCVVQSGGTRPAKPVLHKVQQRLIDLAIGSDIPVRERDASGEALNWLGDPRPGVGLTPEGLPSIVWCDVPEGEFVMGGEHDVLSFAADEETPQCRLRLDAFRVSKHPITNAQFSAFVHDGGYTKQWQHCWTKMGWDAKGNRIKPDNHDDGITLPNYPVVMTTWYEAMAFCSWLSEKLRIQVSLPTEAHWEKSARGTDGRRYPWGQEITPNHANYAETRIVKTTAVGIFPKGASPYGALDMSGNIWEWTRSAWDRDWRIPEPDYLPDETNACANPPALDRPLRVVRGGSYGHYAVCLHCAYRRWSDPNYRSANLGFRVVML